MSVCAIMPRCPKRTIRKMVVMKVHKRYTVDEETLREDPKRYGKKKPTNRN